MSALPRAIRKHLPGHRADTPEEFLLDAHEPGERTVVACIGDSITQGQVSSNYVNMLRHRWESDGFQFINAGVNGDLAYNVAQRLDQVIDCRPDIVTLLVGTNDVNAQLDQKWEQRYIKDQKLPVTPTLRWYAENVELILTRLQAETSAEIVVLEVPLLGEDVASRMNELVGDYNRTLGEIAARNSVPVLPLNASLVELLPTHHAPPPYTGDVMLIMKSGLLHLALRRSWDDISRRNGLAALTDQIHLNDRAATVVADLISDVLGGPGQPGAPTS